MLSKKPFLLSAGPDWSRRRQPASSQMNIAFVWKHMIPTVPVTDDSVNISSTWTTNAAHWYNPTCWCSWLYWNISMELPRVTTQCRFNQHKYGIILFWSGWEMGINCMQFATGNQKENSSYFCCIRCLKCDYSNLNHLNWFFFFFNHRFHNQTGSLLEIHDCSLTFK